MIAERRILEIERRLENQAREIEALRRKVVELGQMVPRAFSAGAGSGGGEPTRLCWAQIPSGGVDAATGTWPSLTPKSFAADVYCQTQSGWVKVAESATVYWRYKQGADAGKLVPCVPNAGGSYEAILDSCEVV